MISIEEFNNNHDDYDGFRVVPVERKENPLDYWLPSDGSYIVQQWCPEIKKWHKTLILGSWGFIAELENPFVPTYICDQIKLRSEAFMMIKENDNISYFKASSTEDIGKASLYVLSERHSKQFYDVCIDDPIKPNHQPEEFEDNPIMHEACKRAWNRYKDCIMLNEIHENMQNRINSILEKRDYVEAYKFLCERATYDDAEDVKLNNMLTIPFDLIDRMPTTRPV